MELQANFNQRRRWLEKGEGSSSTKNNKEENPAHSILEKSVVD